MLDLQHMGFRVLRYRTLTSRGMILNDVYWILNWNLCVYSSLLAHGCNTLNGSFSRSDARMNIQEFNFSMLILGLDMAVRGAISKLEGFVLAR
jgi:hypothetical protein